MKKLLILTSIGLMLFGSTNFAFAGTHVSEMAITKGGQQVAECAQSMDLGISKCLDLSECNNEM